MAQRLDFQRIRTLHMRSTVIDEVLTEGERHEIVVKA